MAEAVDTRSFVSKLASFVQDPVAVVVAFVGIVSEVKLGWMVAAAAAAVVALAFAVAN